jgi:ParB-like chromosome segregation protein Spo0J
MAATDPTTTERPLSQHPISATFPELSDDECKLLKDAIEAHRQKYPILVTDDQILDGWHRYKACRGLGIEPKLEEFTRPDPVSVVISFSLEKIEHRLASQRAKAGSTTNVIYSSSLTLTV